MGGFIRIKNREVFMPSRNPPTITLTLKSDIKYNEGDKILIEITNI